jgi:hypothetical protein
MNEHGRTIWLRDYLTSAGAAAGAKQVFKEQGQRLRTFLSCLESPANKPVPRPHNHSRERLRRYHRLPLISSTFNQ